MRQPGRRIAVVGGSGSGKTYVAGQLAERLGIPFVCNDSIIWRPNWTETPRDRRPQLFAEALAGDAFAFDGNFGSMKDAEDSIILSRLDTIVWLDLPLRAVFPQLLRRTITRAWSKEELWHGNRESWRLSFCSGDSILLWSLRTHQRYRRLYAQRINDPRFAHVTWVHLTRRRQVNAWLDSVIPVCAADQQVVR